MLGITKAREVYHGRYGHTRIIVPRFKGEGAGELSRPLQANTIKTGGRNYCIDRRSTPLLAVICVAV